MRVCVCVYAYVRVCARERDLNVYLYFMYLFIDIPSLKFPVQYCPLFADRQLIISCVAALSSFQNDRWHWYLDDVALDGGTWWLVVSKPGRYRCSYASHENGEKDILEFDVKEPHGGSPRRPNEWQFCAYNITLNDGS